MKKDALRAAFPRTIPIMAGFLFLGTAYGVYVRSLGLSFLYPLCMSLFIFGGSLEFVTAEMLIGSFSPLSAFMMAILIQMRHIFYGISMLSRYKGIGRKKIYMIFALCDETFSVNCGAEIPENVDRGWFMFFVSLLDQLYWVAGATAGGLIGGSLPFSTEGISFVMTAMFAVIFLEQILKEKTHCSSIIGAGASLLALFIFGADHFLIPAMAGILLLLMLFKKNIEGKEGVL